MEPLQLSSHPKCNLVIRGVQKEAFLGEFTAILNEKTLAKESTLFKHSLILEDHISCMGNRLKHANLDMGEKNPVILPKRSQISALLIPVTRSSFHRRNH